MAHGRRFISTIAAAVGVMASLACGVARADEAGVGQSAFGRTPAREAVGRADWRGEAYDGRATATGERFDMYRLTAASPDLPLGGYAYVTNLATGESVLVKINDRAPAGSVISLSFAAAHRLGVDVDDPARVKVSWVGATPPVGQSASAGTSPPPTLARFAARLISDDPDPVSQEARRGLFHARGRREPLSVTWVEDQPEPIAGL